MIKLPKNLEPTVSILRFIMWLKDWLGREERDVLLLLFQVLCQYWKNLKLTGWLLDVLHILMNEQHCAWWIATNLWRSSVNRTGCFQLFTNLFLYSLVELGLQFSTWSGVACLKSQSKILSSLVKRTSKNVIFWFLRIIVSFKC